jgi:hypothetical protein
MCKRSHRSYDKGRADVDCYLRTAVLLTSRKRNRCQVSKPAPAPGHSPHQTHRASCRHIAATAASMVHNQHTHQTQLHSSCIAAGSNSFHNQTEEPVSYNTSQPWHSKQGVAPTCRQHRDTTKPGQQQVGACALLYTALLMAHSNMYICFHKLIMAYPNSCQYTQQPCSRPRYSLHHIPQDHAGTTVYSSRSPVN